jgi:hypothetical protein
MKYDVSIIMPYYKKYNEFKIALKKNKKQFKLVKEVIILFDEIIDISTFEFLKEYNINFKFFTNTENHNWRNPAVVLNYGITKSQSEYCIIISPESILMKNFIKNIMENTNETNFSTGKVIFLKENRYNKLTYNELDNLFTQTPVRNNEIIGHVYFGSLCCKKSNLEKAYYDEKFIGWGGEDDDIRKRLINLGLVQNKLDNVKVIHTEDNISFNKRLYKTHSYQPITNLYNKFIEIKNKPLSIDYNSDKFIKFYKKEKIFSYYPIILLCQCYNEENNVKKFLKNVNNFVDGIIILDDSSTDKSWELMVSDKILVKAQKKRTTFNDLENRNLLLEIFNNLIIKNNIRVDWFIWLDFDERISECKNTVNMLRNLLLSSPENKNIYNIPLVHMWNDNDYNIEYPLSDNGVQYHTRIIRNIVDYAPYKIISNINLHFKLNPYNNDKYIFPLLIKHLGRNSESIRLKKYNLYTTNYDIGLKYQSSYNHFLNNMPKLKNYEINKNEILFKTLNLNQIVILYDYGQKHMKYIKNKIMSPLLVKIKNINNMPNWLNNKHKILLLFQNEELLINVKKKLNINKIKYIGSENTKILTPENNNYYIGILNNKPQILCKYENNYVIEIFMPAINRKKLQERSLEFFKNNGGVDYGLINLKFMSNDIYEFINVDTNPSIKQNSPFTLSAAFNGYNYKKFIENLIN